MYSSPGHLVINLDAIKSNWLLLNRQVGGNTECAAVVKANAYGLGVEVVATALASVGCHCFFVSSVAEGIELRRCLGCGPTIYVLHGCEAGAESLFTLHDLRPVLVSIEMVIRWQVWLAENTDSPKAALKIDTGMSRLGLALEQARVLLDKNSDFFAHISLLMSHMACADEPDHPLNQSQLEAFGAFDKSLQDRGLIVPKSLSNSAAIFLGSAWHFDIVRPGLALYGVSPTPGKGGGLRPVVSLSLRVVQVRTILKGESIGYGATYTAQEQRVLAIVAGGYADGVSRSLSNSGQAWIKGLLVPIIGRVSMDTIILDVTEVVCAGESIAEGDKVELVGDHITVAQHAASAGLVAYETLTQLGARFERIYIDNGEPVTAKV